MKKKFLSILICFSFLIGIFHHSIVNFHHYFQHINTFVYKIQLSENHSHNYNESVNNENHSHNNYILKRGNSKLKVLKDIVYFGKIDINGTYQICNFDNINLFKKQYPPHFTRNIKNYSYSDMVKIIKSNT